MTCGIHATVVTALGLVQTHPAKQRKNWCLPERERWAAVWTNAGNCIRRTTRSCGENYGFFKF